MRPVLVAALLSATLSPAVAQTAPSGGNPGYSGPGITHTGPRYCPELADTGHPFAAVCPSHRDSIVEQTRDVQIAPITRAEGAELGAPIWSNGR